jgi:antitoxin MazE
MTVRVQKWGNSLGVRIPKAIATQSDIREGTELNISHADGLVTLRPVTVPTLKELLSQAKPQNRPALVDWGNRVGKEAW